MIKGSLPTLQNVATGYSCDKGLKNTFTKAYTNMDHPADSDFDRVILSPVKALVATTYAAVTCSDKVSDKPVTDLMNKELSGNNVQLFCDADSITLQTPSFKFVTRSHKKVQGNVANIRHENETFRKNRAGFQPFKGVDDRLENFYTSMAYLKGKCSSEADAKRESEKLNTFALILRENWEYLKIAKPIDSHFHHKTNSKAIHQ